MKAIMLQGTASDVGKSVLSTAFCRYFLEEGFRVAPFKSQNMALNSYVTLDGGEIGRSQGVQAEAAGIDATVDMNPVLLKPKGDMVTEVIVHGRHFADVDARSYRGSVLDQVLGPIRESLDRLSREYEVLVIEGAGSPAEINLKNRDVVNMRIARMANAPVLLVADIERGGVFASIVGTLELLEPEDRARVKGIVINKFRGSKEVLEPGIDWMEKRTGVPVLGVLPHVEIGIDPEDSMSLDTLQLKGTRQAKDALDVAVIRFPRISNFTDFLPLMKVADISVRYVKSVCELGQPDILILPGTKNTMDDLDWLKQTGLATEILRLKQQHVFVTGICGGYQMLGKKLSDPDGIESDRKEQEGLDLLPVETRFVADKQTARIQGQPLVSWGGPEPVAGYEIHMGRTRLSTGASPLFRLSDDRLEGAVSEDGAVWGTCLHGVFDNPAFTNSWLNRIRRIKGLPQQDENTSNRQQSREEIYQFLSQWVRKHLDMEKVKEIMKL